MILAFGATTGCRKPIDADALGTGVGTTPTAAVAPSPAADTNLIRAPEVFQVAALARWNGRRTARGVWIAHPEVRSPMQVRVVNPRTGQEVDGIVYQQRGSDAGDVLTVSSDAAAALGMKPDREVQLNVFALRPKPVASTERRRSAQSKAQQELAAHIAQMDQNRLLQVAAAAMRGMGYATVFEPLSDADTTPTIHAFARPGAANLPAIRVIVQPGGLEPIPRTYISNFQTLVGQKSEIGILISVAGFAKDAGAGLKRGRAHVELLDRDALMNLWLMHYDQLSEPDRSLLRLQPVYFLAGG